MKKRTNLGFTILLMTAAAALAFLFAPERTQDGLVHLYWNSAWAAQIQAGDWFPQWHAQAYGGLGNAAFLFYPPLSRYVALPYFLLGLTPIIAMKSAAASVAVINVLGALHLANYLLKRGSLSHKLMMLSLAMNPYLFYCLFWRGAYAECLAISLLPFFIRAALQIFDSLSSRNGATLAVVTGLIAVAHIPTLIIIFFLFNAYSVLVFIGNRNRSALLWRTCFFGAGLVLASPYLGSVALNMGQIRQPTWYSISDNFAFGSNFRAGRHPFMNSLIFGVYLVPYLLAIRPVLKRRQHTHAYDMGMLLIWAGLALFMCQPLSAIAYKLIPLIKKIQFPVRFLAMVSVAVPALAMLSASLRFRTRRSLLLGTLPVIAALCLPHYFLLQSVLTPSYQSPANKQAYDSLITDRLQTPVWAESVNPNDNQASLAETKDIRLIEVGGKEVLLAADKMVFSDVVDYLPESLAKKGSFWRFDGNVVAPTQGYRDHYSPNDAATLVLTKTSPARRRWNVEATAKTTVDLGITAFSNWQVTTVPAGRVSDRQISPDGLISVSLQPGRYQLVADYTSPGYRVFLLLSFFTAILLLMRLIYSV